MNPEIKAQWTAALRSGEYQQSEGKLRTDDGYCCLGVLCDLAVKAKVIGEPHWGDNDGYGGYYKYGAEHNDAVLPAEVTFWAGIDDPNPDLDTTGPELPAGAVWDQGADEAPNLAQLNDGGTTFAVIADIIDAQL
jgi:hypothetical protein